MDRINLETCPVEATPQAGVSLVWSVSPQALGTVEESEQTESSWCRVLQAPLESIRTQLLEKRQSLLPAQFSSR